MSEERSLIQVANEQMTIIEACNELGMEVFDFSIASLKTYCPFGHIYHIDEGQSKAFRIYPGTNSAWCFACQMYFTPVKLIAMDKNITEREAAEVILEKTNYVAPDYESRWTALQGAPVDINTEDLAEALKVACARMDPDWEDRQIDDPLVAERLRRCLGLLSKVKTEDDATKWLNTTKQVMMQTLGART